MYWYRLKGNRLALQPPARQQAGLCLLEGLALRQSDRSVARVYGKRLAAPIHLAAHFRLAEGAFDRHGYPQADVPIPRRSIDIGLKVSREGNVHAAVPGAQRPAGGHFAAGKHPCIHAAVARLDVQRLEPSDQADVSIARVGLDLAIQVAGFNMAISSAELDVAFECVYGDAAVAGMKIDRPAKGTSLYCPVPRMNVQRSAEAVRLYRPIAGIRLQIPLLRHAHFDMQPPGIVAPVEVDPPVSGHSCDKLNLITILPGIDPKVLAQFVALVFHAKLNLLGVPGSYSHAAIIGLHAHIRSPRNRKGLGDFLGARSLGQSKPSGQDGRACKSHPKKRFHIVIPSAMHNTASCQKVRS